MRKYRVFLLSAPALFAFSALASALNTPLPAVTQPRKAEPAAAVEKRETAAPRPGAIDFDAYSATDPLYREGSKQMLKNAVKAEEPAKAEAKPAKSDLRDAPNSGEGKPAKFFKKVRAPKPLHTDPVKAKNAL